MKKIQLLDVFIKYISIFTLLSLGICVILRYTLSLTLPVFVNLWLVPILTAGAVGYITNWIAIYLLFKPYNRTWGIQGIIPRSKGELGKTLGSQIPERLLKPEELVLNFNFIIKEYLHDKNFLDSIRRKVDIIMNRYSENIASYLLPFIDDAIKDVLNKNMTQDNLLKLYDTIIIKYLSDESNRDILVNGISNELKSRAPEITQCIKEYIRSESKVYLKNKLPFGCGAEQISNGIVGVLDWDKIHSMTKDKLSEPATMKMISKEVQHLSLKIKHYLQSPEASGKITLFIEENKEKAECVIKDYLTEHLPLMAHNALKTDMFWNIVEMQLLPTIQKFFLSQLQKHKNVIINKLDLSGKIEKSVENMDIKELHKMINQVSGEHLTLIQILGYFLGLFFGTLMVFA